MFRSTIPILLTLLLFSGCSREPRGSENTLTDLFPISQTSQPAATDDSWAAATSPRPFSFPSDHAAHEDYRIEWWYYTGNLEAHDGRRFGYQLTFFRTGLHKEPANPSKWTVRDLYTAHFAISDMSNKQHHCFQRNNRQGIGRAGANTECYEVWNGDWKAWLWGEDHRLQAAESDVEIDLTLSPAKRPVLHGTDGLSQKGPTTGNASHYYSLTRMPTKGMVRIAGKTLKIHGNSWMDHEFSSSFLEPGQLGWDWLAIQLDNDVELMLYRMRREDSTTDPYSSGSLVNKVGDLRHLSATDYKMTPLGNWKSFQTGAIYPLQWRIEIASLGYVLDVRSAFDEQEMTTTGTTGISYWEGAIDVSGHGDGGEVAGRGYMELTGYTGQGLGSLFE